MEIEVDKFIYAFLTMCNKLCTSTGEASGCASVADHKREQSCVSVTVMVWVNLEVRVRNLSPNPNI